MSIWFWLCSWTVGCQPVNTKTMRLDSILHIPGNPPSQNCRNVKVYRGLVKQTGRLAAPSEAMRECLPPRQVNSGTIWQAEVLTASDKAHRREGGENRGGNTSRTTDKDNLPSSHAFSNWVRGRQGLGETCSIQVFKCAVFVFVHVNIISWCQKRYTFVSCWTPKIKGDTEVLYVSMFWTASS